jgi:predicted unusual protein kinase regulating ubiquinone biosynthesis (AarF/ABC1/UbiB family)
MDDLSTFAKIKRYAQTTSAVGGMATRLAGDRYFNIPLNDAAYSKELRKTLGNLKGPLMKVAQFLATIPDALPAEYATELLTLQSQAPAMGIPFVKRRMQAELGADWQTKFQKFDLTASAAASLGQVHKAIHLEGNTLACKLQYPGMSSLIEADLGQLNIIFNLYEKFNDAIKTADIKQEIKERLFEELDYQNELKNLKTYDAFFKGNSSIHIPKPDEALCTDRLLTLEWIDGESIFTKLNESQEYRDNLGKLLFQAWYEPFYKQGMIHADPHPGNYLVLNSEPLSIALLDFGCVRYFSDTFIDGVKNLYNALQNNDQELAVHAYTQWGFSHLSKEIIDIITNWAKLLYDPLLDDSVRTIQQTSSGAKGWEMAQKVHNTLHKAGGICPPQEFVFMDRAAVGIGSVLMRLNAKQNWHRLFEEMIQ